MSYSLRLSLLNSYASVGLVGVNKPDDDSTHWLFKMLLHDLGVNSVHNSRRVEICTKIILKKRSLRESYI